MTRDDIIYSLERCASNVSSACKDCKYIDIQRESIFSPITDNPCIDCMTELICDTLTLFKRGQWIPVINGRGGHECSLCHNYAPSFQSGEEHLTEYCPTCGAQMKRFQARNKERIMIIYEPFEEDKEFQINVYLTYYVDNEDYDDDCIQEEDVCNGEDRYYSQLRSLPGM